MTVTVSAPAKAILLGEHAAAYGRPALAVALDLRSYISVSKRKDNKILINAPEFKIQDYLLDEGEYSQESSALSLISETIRKTQEHIRDDSGLDIHITTEIPIASGLGSSASIASAMILAIASESKFKLEKQEIANLAWQCEHIIHSKSSGVDPFTVIFGGLCLYQKGGVKTLNVSDYPTIVIAHSGLTSNTGEIVERVDQTKKGEPELFEDLLNIVENIVTNGKESVEDKNWGRLGLLMNINHGLLSAIGVSCIQLERLVYAARSAGSLGSKLCGAGRGGIAIALVDEKNEDRVKKVLVRSGGGLINARPTTEGIKIEKQ